MVEKDQPAPSFLVDPRLGELVLGFEKTRSIDEGAEAQIINTAKDPLIGLAVLIGAALEEGGIRPGEFLEEVTREIESSREVLERARRVMPLIDKSFDDLPLKDQEEYLFGLDSLYLRLKILELHRTQNPDVETTNALEVMMEEFGGRFESENVLNLEDGRVPRRTSSLRIPTSNIPSVYMQEEDHRIRRGDLLENTKAMEKVGYALGVLMEGERWEDFVQRADFEERMKEHVRDMEGKDIIFYDPSPNGDFQVNSVLPNVKASIRFDCDRRQIVQLGKKISLSEALKAGFATPNLELRLPTEYLYDREQTK